MDLLEHGSRRARQPQRRAAPAAAHREAAGAATQVAGGAAAGPHPRRGGRCAHRRDGRLGLRPAPAAGARRGAASGSGGGAPRADGRGGAAGTGAALPRAARRGGLKRRARGVSQGPAAKTLRVDFCPSTRRQPSPRSAWRARLEHVASAGWPFGALKRPVTPGRHMRNPSGVTHAAYL